MDRFNFRPHPVRRLIAETIEFCRDWFLRFLHLDGFDRAMALAGSAFSALIPLLIVYGAVVSDATGRDFATHLVETFDLNQASADALRTAFAPPKEVEDATNGFGALLLILSALSFTRALQRLYQTAFDQTSLGWRAARWGISWLGMIIAVVTLRPIILSGVHGTLDATITLLIAFGLWLVTPYMLLAYRVPRRTLMPTALLTALGMSAYSASSAVWMPRAVASSAQQFGAFGVAFAMLSWLVGAGVVLVVTTGGGAVIAERLGMPLQDTPGDPDADVGVEDLAARRARSDSMSAPPT